MGGRISFWNSRKVLKLASFLENYPGGFYTNRWTDQTYWHNALALYLPNYSARVLNIEAERTMAVSNEEELQGSFFHAKNLDQQAMNLYCETGAPAGAPPIRRETPRRRAGGLEGTASPGPRF